MSANVGGGRDPGVGEPEFEVEGDEFDTTLEANQSFRRLELLLGQGWGRWDSWDWGGLEADGCSEVCCGVVMAEPLVTPDEET